MGPSVPSGLPADYLAVIARGTRLDRFNPGSAEYALDRQTALQAIATLEGTAHVILGGDVVEIGPGGLRYADDWSVMRKPSETDASFAARSQVYAGQFIEECSPRGMEPLFVLVVI